MDEVRERIRLRLVEVDNVGPTDVGDNLVVALAVSVEREATVKRLRTSAAKLRGVPLFGYAMRVLNEEADAIENGEHR